MDCIKICEKDDARDYEMVFDYPPNISNKKKRLLRKKQKQKYRRRVKMFMDTIVEERNEHKTIKDLKNDDFPEWIIVQ
jgi:guanylate kinase